MATGGARDPADDQLRQIVLARISTMLSAICGSAITAVVATELLGKIQRGKDLFAPLRRQPLQSRCLYINRVPVGIQLARQAGGCGAPTRSEAASGPMHVRSAVPVFQTEPID